MSSGPAHRTWHSHTLHKVWPDCFARRNLQGGRMELHPGWVSLMTLVAELVGVGHSQLSGGLHNSDGGTRTIGSVLVCKRPCRDSFGETSAVETTRLQGASSADCAFDYSQKCPDQFVLKGSRCEAPKDFSGRCGFSLSSEYGATEKASYAEACLTPW